MPMRLRVHADDIGVSPGVTEGILRCIDEGPVESTSIIANGVAFDEAAAALRARPRIAVSVHLNLIEGRPVAPAQDVSLLVDGDGYLRHSFPSLWRAHAVATPTTRTRLEAQVRDELRAQVQKVRAALGAEVPLRLDSHQHLHHIPFVFRIVAELRDELSTAGIRLAREPFFVCTGTPRAHTPGGVVKHALLATLAARLRRAYRARNVAADDWFVGVQLTGRMSPSAVDAALRRIHALSPVRASVEILFHPGGAHPGEEWIWQRYPGLHAYYFSPWRRVESEGLRSPAMATCLARWRGSTRGN